MFYPTKNLLSEVSPAKADFLTPVINLRPRKLLLRFFWVKEKSSFKYHGTLYLSSNLIAFSMFCFFQNNAINFLNINPLMPGGNKKVTHTSTNLQLSAAGLFKYV